MKEEKNQHLIKLGNTLKNKTKTSLPLELIVNIFEEANNLFYNNLQESLSILFCTKQTTPRTKNQLEEYCYEQAKNLLTSSAVVYFSFGEIFKNTKLINLKKQQKLKMEANTLINKLNNCLDNTQNIIKDITNYKNETTEKIAKLRKENSEKFEKLKKENETRMEDLNKENDEIFLNYENQTNVNFNTFILRLETNTHEIIDTKNSVGDFIREATKRKIQEEKFYTQSKKRKNDSEIDFVDDIEQEDDENGGNDTDKEEKDDNNSVIATPTIIPYGNFNAQNSAELLSKNMKVVGIDKGKIIKFLIKFTNAQRQEISQSYKHLYGTEMVDELKSLLSIEYEVILRALMDRPAFYDAAQLRRAIEVCKEEILIEIMLTRDNTQILLIRSAYLELYGNEIERDIIGDSPGYFVRLLVALCSGSRNESNITDPVRANEDALKLYRAIKCRLARYEEEFIRILANENYEQLRLTLNEFQHLFGPIDQARSGNYNQIR